MRCASPQGQREVAAREGHDVSDLGDGVILFALKSKGKSERSLGTADSLNKFRDGPGKLLMI